MGKGGSGEIQQVAPGGIPEEFKPLFDAMVPYFQKFTDTAMQQNIDPNQYMSNINWGGSAPKQNIPTQETQPMINPIPMLYSGFQLGKIMDAVTPKQAKTGLTASPMKATGNYKTDPKREGQK